MEIEDRCAHTKCVIGQSENFEVSWVQCDGKCNMWFHMDCAGYPDKQGNEEFFCDTCKFENREKKKRIPTKKIEKAQLYTFPVDIKIFTLFVEMALEKIKNRTANMITLSAHQRLKASLQPEEASISILHQLLKKSLSQEKKKPEEYWTVMHKLRCREDFLVATMQLMYVSTEDLPAASKPLAQSFSQYLLEAIEGELFKKHLISTDSPSTLTGTCQPTDNIMQDAALRHVAGAVLHKVIKQAKKDGDEEFMQEFLNKTTKQRATEENEWLTDAISRGGLIFVSDDWYQMFKKIDTLTNSLYNDAYCTTRKSEAIAMITGNATIQHLWQNLACGKTQLLDVVIQKFLANRGFLMERILREKFEQKQVAEKKKKNNNTENERMSSKSKGSGLRKRLKPVN